MNNSRLDFDAASAVLAYTIPDTCRATGLGRTKIYELISAGRIKAVACDGRTLIPAESLRGFLASLPPAQIRSNLAA